MTQFQMTPFNIYRKTGCLYMVEYPPLPTSLRERLFINISSNITTTCYAQTRVLIKTFDYLDSNQSRVRADIHPPFFPFFV